MLLSSFLFYSFQIGERGKGKDVDSLCCRDDVWWRSFNLLGLGCRVPGFTIISGGVRCPEGQVVSQQLHDKRRVLVAVLVQGVQLGNGFVECLKRVRKKHFSLVSNNAQKAWYRLLQLARNLTPLTSSRKQCRERTIRKCFPSIIFSHLQCATKMIK